MTSQKSIYQVFILITLALLFSSCTSHWGSIQGSRCKGNCYYNSIAVGCAEKSQFIGIGGNNTDALLFEAKRSMYRAFPLGKGEFYDNFITDFKSTNYIFIKKTLVTITADVVTENGDDTDIPFSENYQLSLSSDKITSIDGINLSDSVVYLNGASLIRGVVIDFNDHESKVIVNNSKGNQVVETVQTKKLFTIGNEELEDKTDLEAGQVIEYSSNTSKDGGTKVKTVVGLRADKVLISTSINNKVTYSVMPVKQSVNN